jgi:hypothetical protein
MEYIVKWRNQGGVVESRMIKWVLALYNDGGTLIKSVENNDPTNLRNFSQVEIKLPLTTAEAQRQTGENKIKVYFDSIDSSTNIGEMTVLFDITRLSLKLEKIDRIVYDRKGYDFEIPSTTKYLQVRGLPAKKFTNEYGAEFLHTKPFKFTYEGSNRLLSIFIYKEDMEGYIIFLMGADVVTEITSLDPSLITKVYIQKYWSDTKDKKRDGPFQWIITGKEDMEYWISTLIGKPHKITRKPTDGDIFTCSSNDPIGSAGDYKYEVLAGGGDIKWLPGSTLKDTTSPHNCTTYNYTGVKNVHASTNGRCGPRNGNTICPGSQCCSTSGWCYGNVGEYSAWCSDSENINSKYSTYIGGEHDYDGTNLGGMKVKVSVSVSASVSASDANISTNGRCAWANNNKRCPGRQCCSSSGWCAGNIGTQSAWCSKYQSSGGWVGYNSSYDGRPSTTTSTTITTKNLTEALSNDMVLKCALNDPLNNNNGTIYKWDSGTSSIKDVASAPSGYTVTHTLRNCAGVDYGGKG